MTDVESSPEEAKISLRNLSMVIALILITAFFALHPKGGMFLSPQNLYNLSIELTVTATLALGMLLILLIGEIDLSAGSGVGMIGGLAAVLITVHQWPAIASLISSILVAVVVWWAMGTLIVKARVPSFIITLGGLLIFKGLHWMVIENATVPVAPGGQANLYSLLTTWDFPRIGSWILVGVVAFALTVQAIKKRKSQQTHGFKVEDGTTAFLKVFVAIQGLILLVIIMNQHKGVPLALVILGVVATCIYLITSHTKLGRYLYAIGGNVEAASLSGVPVMKVTILAYVIFGIIVALTGFLQTAYGGYSTTTVGALMELDAIAACVIGGTSLKGGRGTVAGVLFGALIMAVLLNGMTLLAVSPEAKLIARGSVLVLAVWMDVFMNKK
ncbi:MAG: ATPase [Lentisphaeria bacterium]|nr:ATPase [Lentisphaeria bacterium]